MFYFSPVQITDIAVMAQSIELVQLQSGASYNLKGMLFLSSHLCSSFRPNSQVHKKLRSGMSSISSDENSNKSFWIRQDHAVYILPAPENENENENKNEDENKNENDQDNDNYSSKQG